MKFFLRLLLIGAIIVGIAEKAGAQGCSLGQTPGSAFPVCGISEFSQAQVPECNGRLLPVPCTDGVPYGDLNAYWYSFTCYIPGTLVFSIDPLTQSDDYDWQLFDITGHTASEVYTNASLYVASNWSAESGATGTSASATNVTNCAGFSYPNFSKAPQMQLGHQYLLMVSHFTSTNQSGYDLNFDDATSINITDPAIPNISWVEATCDGTQFKVKLNKKIKCNSIAANGSDFSLIGPVKIIAAEGFGCDSSFETDSLILTLSKVIIPAYQTLIVKTGSDGNTLTDNCNTQIADSTTFDFRVYERQPTPFDTILPVNCRPKVIELAFNKNIRCNSIAPDGSDFFMTGSYPVGVLSASGRCSNEVTKVIKIELSQRLQTEGTFLLNLKIGSDGNTLIDECSEETPLPESAGFSVKDTVSAHYTYNLLENCTNDKIDLFNTGGASITQWSWSVDDTITSALQNPSFTFDTYGNKKVQLIVTNGFCTDSVAQLINFPHDTLLAAFNGPALYCPNDIAIFTDTSKGNIVEWNWQFGNGRTSNIETPPAQTYYTTQNEKIFPVSLAVRNTRDCYDTAIHYIKVTSSCYIAVPSAFTPNGDGNNDFLYPLNAYKATGLYFSVYNRHGQRLYETRDWTKKWNGSYNGQPQPTGVYVWMLQYKDEFGKDVFLRGTTVLLR